MVTQLINPPSKLHYLRNLRSPALLGCDCKYNPAAHPAMCGVGFLRAIGDATGAGVPAGTVLAYSASWPRPKAIGSFLHWNDPNWIQSTMQGPLAQKWGVVVDSQSHSTSDWINTSGVGSFVLQVHTVSDYGAPDDVRSIIDGEFYAATGTMPQSTIRVVQAVSPSVANPNATFPAQASAAMAAAQAGYTDAIARGDSVSAAQFAAQIKQLGGQDPRGITGWLSDNWLWLAAAGVGVVVLKEVL